MSRSYDLVLGLNQARPWSCWRQVLAEGGSPHKWLSRVRPSVGVGVLAVVVLQESDQPVLEVGCEAEVPALEESARDDTEPKFHLIEPRAMDRGKVKHMAVPDIRQELAALRPGRKRLGVEGDSAQVCHR